MNPFKDKIILVTGGTGTIGSQLVHRLLEYRPKKIRILSRNETRQHLLMEKLQYLSKVTMFIGDIRDKERLDLACAGVDFIFHTAALKHVPFCEYNPYEAVKTNILGAQNVIDCAVKNKVRKVIAISTDKAANPFGVMGVSKLMMEKLFINANFSYGNIESIFSCVRFGNVAWSSGSVLSAWEKQAEDQGVIKVMQKNMTRFLMSVEQAVNLTLEAATISQGAEIFILKMPSIKLNDLFKMFIAKYYPGKTIVAKEIGLRPGEKMHEELLSVNDFAGQVWTNKDMFVILPVVNIYNFPQPKRVYKNFKRLLRFENYLSSKHLDTKEVGRII